MKLFISYRRSDSVHAAQRVRMCLQTHFGEDAVFIDREIPAGADWETHLKGVLEQSTDVIVLVGDEFLRELRRNRDRQRVERDTLEWEIETALQLKRTIYPVLIGALDMPDAARLPESIRRFASYQAVFAREPAFDAAMAVLIKSISDEHGWVKPPAPAADTASAPTSRSAVPLMALSGVVSLWLVGQLVLWLRDGAGGVSAAVESAFWHGAVYALSTVLLGLGPYLAYRGVIEVRARARLPTRTLHALLSWCNLAAILIVGGAFLLLSTREGWSLKLIGLMPQAPSAGQYVMQGFVLVGIVLAAMWLAMLEPRVRQLDETRRAWGMAFINAGDIAVLLGAGWVCASLVTSTPAPPPEAMVPTIGYLMLCPALSLLVGARDFAQAQLGPRGKAWQVRALFWLAIALYLACTL
ncbi:MAG TPA: TIR domain-containing protein, partial [Burkholderiaceae bacterium]|nr:TIR domain-containing protein [Burkholderiaceae bacterium]